MFTPGMTRDPSWTPSLISYDPTPASKRGLSVTLESYKVERTKEKNRYIVSHLDLQETLWKV